MNSDSSSDDALPRALSLLWHGPTPARNAGTGLSRERIVAAAIDLADSDGLAALSMARLAERLGCGTMSLYRHVASKDELLIFMLSAAPGPPPTPTDRVDWQGTLTDWALRLWDVYHRHPWILQAASAGPPADPGQLAWLDAGLSTLRSVALTEPEKLSVVMSLLYYVRGAAALAVESAGGESSSRYPDILRKVIDPDRFPSIAAALAGGAFDATGDDDVQGDFLPGVRRLIDGIDAQVRRSHRR